MLKSFSVSALILLCFSLLETAILSNISVLPAVPDLVLLCVLYFSLINGRMYGESTGFISGLFLDFLSGAPFGFNCVLRTLIGYLSGWLGGTVNYSGFFMPVLIGFCGTFAKTLIIWLMSLFYTSIITYQVFSVMFLFELIANSLLAPFVFKFLNLFKNIISTKSEEIE